MKLILVVHYEPRKHTYGVGLDEINVVLYSVGGKDNFGKVIRYLQFLQIPWVVLCDGDALDPFKGRNGRTLLTQLTEAGIEPKDMQSKDFRKQVRWLNTVGVYISGTNYNGKFEKVWQIAAALKLAPEGTKPQQGRWVAQTIACPPYLTHIFDRVIKRAGNRSVQGLKRRS